VFSARLGYNDILCMGFAIKLKRLKYNNKPTSRFNDSGLMEGIESQ